ncbi:porin family protein [Pelomonas sp. V22]|uniref:outer membrane beta-barrel protein n=1 Tax=Pelomonas sp. V22 TaxID=2822139 RepID=UPI0024A9779E|nr:outer membrane beta-barrel protein [Pelomonas sp. V22]MDI4632128.1 porin family protein [Pelomonas sp. V22]
MKKIIALAALAFIAAHASAADKTWYIGGDVGSTQFKADGDKERKTGFGATLGYSLNENVAFELQARRLGKASLTETVGSVNYTTTLKANSLSVSVLGILPLNNEFSLFGRLGYARNSLDLSTKASNAAGTVSFDGHKNKALFGFGADYKINNNLSLRAEYVNLGKNKVNVGGIGELESKIQQFNVGANYAF